MLTKQELYDHLMRLQSENALLRRENERMRQVLYEIYSKARAASGIEAAIAEREKNGVQHISDNSQ